jgi:hypothetical protein
MPANGTYTLESTHSAVLPNGKVTFEIKPTPPGQCRISWDKDGGQFEPAKAKGPVAVWIAPAEPIDCLITADIQSDGDGTPETLRAMVEVTPNAPPRVMLESMSAGIGALRDGLPGRSIRLERQDPELTPQKALWAIIRDRTKAISFGNFKTFVDGVMCGGEPGSVHERVRQRLQLDQNGLRYRGTESYEILKRAAEAFLMHESGVLPDEERSLEDLPFPGDSPDLEENNELREFVDEERRRLPRYGGSSAAAVAKKLADNRDLYLKELEKEFRTFPYFKQIRDQLGEIPLKPPGAVDYPCYGLLRSRLAPPLLLELIWSYWHEEGMLVQSLKAISMRFQNRAYNVGPNGKNPLAHLNLDPLRPLGNILWGYIQDEQQRLSVVRRAYEYDHHYGFTIAGKVIPALNAADSRKGFLAAFHNLLHRSSAFYREQADTTKVPDGYPLLNALKECHLLLAEGAHNQFGDLPWTARIEMLIEQWLLARPEMTTFLAGRVMVPYPEPWMGPADQMKSLQGWQGASIRHFRDLGVFGEMILLSVRYGNWSDSHVEDEAKEWAQYWRQEVQAYINGYRAVTSVDLSAEADVANAELARRRALPPAKLLARIPVAS